MLEGTVARLLNHLLGKYVVDLDTENLNVGIFSGHVQLTDLKLKVEALYELGLPIQVKAGTIGKIWLQIPWTSLWSQPVIVNIEDILIVSTPIISGEKFDGEKNKRLVRSFKRQLLSKLDTDGHVIGGPESFSQHLLNNILENLKLSISNIHVRYEDDSISPALCGGVCIGSISAEPTNSKWKAANIDENPDISYYLVKIESLSAYWNAETKLEKWNLPAEYYNWRNAMSGSLKNFSLGNEAFDFILKPMLVKLKLTVEHKTQLKSMTDLIIQDCNFQLSKSQYESIISTGEKFQRMLISWSFISTRPEKPILEDVKSWWKYASNAMMEQRIRPYKWKIIKNVRKQYRGYVRTYKQIISNPNDTELKLDLQQYEDALSVINIVIARQHAKLLAQCTSVNEKNFWAMLPSPERITLCKKINFNETNIVQSFNLRIGNISLSLKNNSKEIFLLTLTQTNLTFKPDISDNTYALQFKIEGLILEGSNEDDQLIYIMGSEHLGNSPAYFLRVNFEKMPINFPNSYKLNAAMDSVEFLFSRYFINDLSDFFSGSILPGHQFLRHCSNIRPMINEALLKNWDINLNIKVPFIVIPEYGTFLKSGNISVIDLGRYVVSTELSRNEINEYSTKMEIEEETYSKLNVECTEMQVLFCQHCDNWKDERKEKDTDLHIIPKTNFSAAYAVCTSENKTIPRYKFNISFHSLKINMSERKIGQILKFTTGFENIIVTKAIHTEIFLNDRVKMLFVVDYLARIEKLVTINDCYNRIRRGRVAKSNKFIMDKRTQHFHKQDINEAWARYVDLPGLDDNISPNNNLQILLRFVVNEFCVIFSRSSDSTDRQYLMFRLGVFTLEIAQMSFGPAYQLSINSILLTDKQHTTSSGQYLDLIHSPFPNTVDVVTVLYRRVSADCPDFWSHFHGVETSLVADFGTINLLLHQEAIHTLIKYSKYLLNKLSSQITPQFLRNFNAFKKIYEKLDSIKTTPVPQGAVKFSHSARLADLNVRVCDSDFDIINIQLSGLELDFLFRANERFVFRSYLSNINVEHLSEVTLYSKVLSTDEDKVYELKYVRLASDISQADDIMDREDLSTSGSFKFQLGHIHMTVLYKLIVQIQRFVINLEAVPYLNQFLLLIKKALTAATETLKANTRIHLSINICGPVLLFPQKSSSPNVMIFDTGELNVENFFKYSSNSDYLENILLKWTGITMTRGVMTLIPSLEMQETLIEPANIHFDIKRYTKKKYPQKLWDADGALDSIQITLGQKDISTLFSIYTDNIGEGKLLDLFPNPDISQVDLSVQDETVRTLEAFFCEPKQKNVLVKFTIEEISLQLFFDSGELLSSPIRDLNHGLCKLRLVDISTNFTIYTDGSLDGKWSADGILVEEIGPDANIYDKGILHTPVDESKNNNCNITINRAPLIDVTMHQNKSCDRSTDIIIGRLSLSLSVPFCEKLALFILECFPKDNAETGIINHGYESEIPNNTKDRPSSLTISLRINKPEFIFIVETTSNRKRYFLTHTEILSDYSRHGNRLNFVVSLSGLYSLFYDVGINSNEPYVILKQCDFEFSKCESEEKGKKIIASVSSIYVQICSGVVHSINDILNDISEHFKVPEENTNQEENYPENEELWDAKKLEEFQSFTSNEKNQMEKKIQHEILLVPKFDIVLIFELEQVQMLLFKSTVELTVYNWSSQLNSTCELTIQGNYFNENLQVWEPWIDPVVVDEQEYKPWDVLIKIFQDRSQPMLGPLDAKSRYQIIKKASTPATTTEDEESGEDMMYLEPVNPLLQNRNNRRVKTSLSTFLDDSDSENEDGAVEKLAGAISDLFTGDWNENEDSDYEHSSEGEDDSDNSKSNPIQEEKVENQSKTTYVLLDAKEVLNLTITPTFLKALNDIFTIYSNKTLSVVPNTETILQNDIGPRTKIELYQKNDDEQDDALLCAKTFENQDSPSNSPTRSLYQCHDYGDEFDNDRDSLTDENGKNEKESSYDFATISSLNFPKETTSQLYDKINSHYLKVHVPTYPVVQTHCSKRKWQKLIKLNHFQLAARHDVGKCGRKLIVSSPLQIKNETCFALSVLYQPSILQELNLEPVGDVTNPFETTMRIAVLEAHEQYNVPLYIAYHCRLFIRPAYAEGQYTSDNGIWWKDLATELDIAHNFHCKPRSDSNLEMFSFRVMLTKNLEIDHLQGHSVPNFVIHLLPPLILHNFLPYSLEVENVGLKQLMKIEPGEKKSVYSIDLTQDQKLLIRVKHEMCIWSGCLNFTTYLDEKVIVLTADVKETKQLAINSKSERETSCNVYFYVPYWIVNKIGLPVQIKPSATNTIYDCHTDDLLLFTYKRHGKQTLNARVYESSWSNEFGLECAGTTGLIICRDIERKKKYLFFLNINLSQMCPRLTKIVTLLPSFYVSNTTNKNLRFMEHNEKSDLWIDIAPKENLVFWPETSSLQMYVKYRDSKIMSQVFNIALSNRTVLRMDKGGALTVEVSGGVTGSFHIKFQEYKYGDAPVLVKNYCPDLFLKVQQQEQSQATLLSPYNSLLYTWDDPTKTRKLVWNVYNNKGEGFALDPARDSNGEEQIVFQSVGTTASSSSEDESEPSVKDSIKKNIRKDKIIIYWLCFREGPQRVLFFTQELKIYEYVLKINLKEHCDIELLLSLAGMGVSIFTKDFKKEHVYACFSDTPAVWEVNVGRRWKTLTLELASWIEDKYKLHYKKCQLREYVHIDFEKMYMLKPFFAELKRSYNPALYLHLRKSKNYQHLNLKLNSVQIDNKINSTIVFQPLPGSNPKENSIIDVDIFKFSNKYCQVYRHVKINIRDFYVNIENDLFLDLKELTMRYKKFKQENNSSYVQDMKFTQDFNSYKGTANENQILIEYLNVNAFEIQVHVSNKIQINVVNNFAPLDFLFPLNMSPYMPLEGVIHKMMQIERFHLGEQFPNIFINIFKQLTTQFLQQYYSHVLGLQVLVNMFAVQPYNTPYDRGISEWEKISGSILYSSRCLLSHINMSPAALEQCVVDTFPSQTMENIQRIRRHGSYHKGDPLPKIITCSSKNFQTGVPNALEQLIVKQQNAGIHCNGEMFFRTTGKALVSLMTRYPDDKSDCVEVAKQAIRRASILGEPIRIQQRLIRYYNKYLGLKPFSVYESMGQFLLETVANSRFTQDIYWSHSAIDRTGKSFLLISLQHIIRINKCRLWGPWEVEWIIDLDDIISMPKMTSNELIFNLRQTENNSTLIKVQGDKEILAWTREKIEQAIIVSMDDKSWTV